jgi:hypothetical protein
MSGSYVWLSRIALGGIFVVSGLAKAVALEGFLQAIVNYRLVTWNIARALGTPLVACELIVGIALLCGWHLSSAAATASLLLLLFSSAVVSAQVRGIRGACGCAPRARGGMIGWHLVARNLGCVCLLQPLIWQTATMEYMVVGATLTILSALKRRGEPNQTDAETNRF